MALKDLENSVKAIWTIFMVHFRGLEPHEDETELF